MAAIFSQTMLRKPGSACGSTGTSSGTHGGRGNRRGQRVRGCWTSGRSSSGRVRDQRRCRRPDHARRKVYERNVEASERWRTSGSSPNPGGHSSIPVKENATIGWPPRSSGSASTRFSPRLNQVTRIFLPAAASGTDTIARADAHGGRRAIPRPCVTLSEGSPWLSSVLVPPAWRPGSTETRQQRPSTDRRRQHQLPHPARPRRGGGYHPSSRGRHSVQITVTSPAKPAPPSPLIRRCSSRSTVSRRPRPGAASRAWTPGRRTASTFGTPACRCTACRRALDSRRHPVARKGRADTGRLVLSGAGVHDEAGAGAGGGEGR